MDSGSSKSPPLFTSSPFPSHHFTSNPTGLTSQCAVGLSWGCHPPQHVAISHRFRYHFSAGDGYHSYESTHLIRDAHVAMSAPQNLHLKHTSVPCAEDREQENHERLAQLTRLQRELAGWALIRNRMLHSTNLKPGLFWQDDSALVFSEKVFLLVMTHPNSPAGPPNSINAYSLQVELSGKEPVLRTNQGVHSSHLASALNSGGL